MYGTVRAVTIASRGELDVACPFQLRALTSAIRPLSQLIAALFKVASHVDPVNLADVEPMEPEAEDRLAVDRRCTHVPGPDVDVVW
jgi:hypothetical protein